MCLHTHDLMAYFFCFSALQQEAEGEHQRPNEDRAETGAGDDSQEHRGGQEAPHPGVDLCHTCSLHTVHKKLHFI